MRCVRLFGIALFTVMVVMTVRTATAPSYQLRLATVREPVDAAAAASRLAAAVQLQTVSQDTGVQPDAELDRLHALLDERFPGVRATLRKEVVGGHGLLLTWPGSDATLRPVVLMAHQDVVPVLAEDVARWQQPPFSGAIADGFVWGRGTLDDKGALMAIFEALERLVQEGQAPKRAILVVSGHDEEVGGEGAKAIAAVLATRRVVPELVLDEGLVIVDGIVPGVRAPVAMIGLAENGYATLKLSVEIPGGHSSMPERATAIGVLAAAVARLEEQQMPARLPETVRGMIEFLGPEMSGLNRPVAANLWLTAPLLRRLLARSASGNAAIRTTTAATIFRAGEKENVLAPQATATVNFRILPGDSVESVVAHVESAVGDRRVRIELQPGAQQPTPVSRVDGPGFAAIQRSVAEVFPDTLVAPGLVLGLTDARYFAAACDCVYRFLPVRLVEGDLARIHGVDERIAIAAHADAIRFYLRLLRNTAF